MFARQSCPILASPLAHRRLAVHVMVHANTDALAVASPFLMLSVNLLPLVKYHNFIMNSQKRSFALLINLNILVRLIAHATQFCSTKRHVHISSLSDASRSTIISFSSLPCDIHDQALWVRDHNTTIFQRSQTMQGAVWIGTDPFYLNTTILANGSLRYNVTIKPAKKNKAKPFIYWSEYYHHVVVDNLLPNTIYYYQCILIDQSTNSFAKNRTNGLVKMNPLNHSLTDKPNLEETVRKRHLKDSNNIHSFRTAPKPGTGARTKVAIIADVGVFQHSKDTLSYMGKEMDSLNAIFLLGDISYANSDHRIWDDWFTMMDGQSFLRSKPIYIVAGNHDTEGNLETGELFTAFETRFLMPQLAPAMLGRVTKPRDTDLNLMYKLPYDYGNSYYSFIYGSSHNIVLNSYTDFEPNSRQYKWLVDELTMKVNRTMTPWLVVMMHCPMYNTFSFHQGDPQPLNARRYLEPLFVQHRVNIVLSGHLHAYMRSKPVINETLGPTGPVHIIVGMSGRQANIPYKDAVPEEWVAVRDHQWFGYATLEYLNQSWARFECIHTGRAERRNLQSFNENTTDIVYIYNQYFM